MSWKEKAQEFGPTSVVFLSTQGASISGIVVGDPILLKGKYQGKEQERIGCPIVTDDGFYLFVVGKRVFRKLVSLEEHFGDSIITVTRLSPEGDTKGQYSVEVSADKDRFRRLRSTVGKEFTEDALNEAIAEANQLMNR